MVIKIIILVLADHRNLNISDKDSSSSIYFSEFVSIFESLYLKLVKKTRMENLTEKAKAPNEKYIIKASWTSSKPYSKVKNWTIANVKNIFLEFIKTIFGDARATNIKNKLCRVPLFFDVLVICIFENSCSITMGVVQ